MTSSAQDAVVDFRGRIMFHCSVCGAAITKDDFFHIGLRFPDPDETKDDYCEAELVDTVTHPRCLTAARAG